MKAVITAILTDQEARAPDTNPAEDGGHLREPILYFTGILRALQFTNVNTQGRYDVATSYTAPLGETPYGAASVFNFFPQAMSFRVPRSTRPSLHRKTRLRPCLPEPRRQYRTESPHIVLDRHEPDKRTGADCFGDGLRRRRQRQPGDRA